MKKLMLLMVAVVYGALLFLSGNALAVPTTWSVNGHEYEVFTLPVTPWEDARTAAQSIGSGWDLATITSAEEQTFINSLLGEPPTSGIVQYWVGGFQPAGSTEPGGNWQWINGEGQFWDNGSTGMYANWGAIPSQGIQEPDNVTNQGFLALDNRFGWGWDDNGVAFVNVINGYVAEKRSVAAVPEPSTMLLLSSGLAAGLGFWRIRKNKV